VILLHPCTPRIRLEILLSAQCSASSGAEAHHYSSLLCFLFYLASWANLKLHICSKLMHNREALLQIVKIYPKGHGFAGTRDALAQRNTTPHPFRLRLKRD